MATLVYHSVSVTFTIAVKLLDIFTLRNVYNAVTANCIPIHLYHAAAAASPVRQSVSRYVPLLSAEGRVRVRRCDEWGLTSIPGV